MNIVQWTIKASKQLRKIKDEPTRNSLYEQAQILAKFPDCTGVKRLKNHSYSYRLRIGNYRLFFEFDGAVKIILIEEVKKRNERTY